LPLIERKISYKHHRLFQNLGLTNFIALTQSGDKQRLVTRNYSYRFRW